MMLEDVADEVLVLGMTVAYQPMGDARDIMPLERIS
jgi:hypothetical protein